MKTIGTKQLETSRLCLRRFKISDAEAAYRNWTSDNEVSRYVRWETHKNVAETKSLLESWVSKYEDGSYNWAVEVKETKELIGNISVIRMSEKNHNCEVGYCYGSAWWNQGYASEALKAVIDFLLSECGMYIVEAKHHSDNPASGRVMQKAGMTKEAVLNERRYNKETGDYHDLVYYSICKSKLSPGGLKKQAYNPYLPSWEYIPDGEPYVFNDRVYVYGSHDFYNGYVFCMGDYVCWSAPVDDLGNWRYEGVIYPKTADPLNQEGKMCLYAPDVTIGPDGRYYLYYVLDKVSVVSVAVCDTPAGQYKFYGYVHYADGTRLGEREGDEPQFDPGVLTEGEKTYLYTGFCGQGDKSRTGAKAVVLGKDMLTIEQEPVLIAPGCEYAEGSGFEGHEFFEASSMRKVGDTYYFIYSSSVMHELCYATSKEPTKGFVYRGVIVSNCDLHIDTYKPAELPMAYGANNHGSIVEINGKWYIFYHRHTNGNWYSRQGCAEEIQILPDGSIPQAEITSCGLNGGALEGKGVYPAYLVCHLF
ncbi:MAG: GNAT family N-acetyltransferase, partial [Lachnospiraceae bacterium]|nr:GNAT family N-acetyltransferase [Lachnospiraceae bacterium]